MVEGWPKPPVQAGPEWGGPHDTRIASERTLTRTYKGSAAKATAAFQEDAARLARQGYVPINQTYTPGSWGAGAFLIALLLAFLLIGILIFIYLIVVKPDGILTVTYEHRAPAVAPAPPAAPVDHVAVLDSLAKMRDQGLISADEYAAKKVELLERL